MSNKPCPDTVKEAGAQLLLAVRLGEKFAAQVKKAVDAVNATRPELLAAGCRNMEYGDGMRHLLEAQMAPFIVQQAHNSFRLGLGAAGFEEPADDDLGPLMKDGIVTPMGGGGGVR